MKTVVLGEVVARSGLTCVRKGLKDYERDLTVANAEGLAGGFGLTKEGAKLLMKFGVDVLTGAEKIFYKKDLVDFMLESSRVLRPFNMPSKEVPGHGVRYVDLKEGKVAVINLCGQHDMKVIGLSSPFYTINWLLEKTVSQGIKTIFVIFHAQATGEKQCLFHYLDGKVTAVIGTHTKVLTSDAFVSEKGTAYITDNGRCGSFMSVGGLNPLIEINKEKTGQPEFSRDCFDSLEMQGVEVESGEDGRARAISVIKKPIELSADERGKLLSEIRYEQQSRPAQMEE